MSSTDPRIDFSDTEIAFKSQTNKQLNLNYLIFNAMNKNWLVNIGTFFIKLFLKWGLPVKFIIKRTIFQLFCGGEDIEDSMATIEKLSKHGVGTILDYSVEGEDEEESFDKTHDEILQTIVWANKFPEKIPFSVFKVTGIGSRDLLTKVQAKEVLDSKDQQAYDKVVVRFQSICKAAAKANVRIFVDGEETWIQDVIDFLALEEMRKYNLDGKAIVYNTYQLYRNQAFAILESHLTAAKGEGFVVGAKLVRGAYMEKERRRANEMGYADPINASKEATDIEYNKGVELSVKNIDSLHFCLGTHNEDSCNLAVGILNSMGVKSNDSRAYFAQLLGMSDNISFNLAAKGYNVAKYVPYGPVEAVMPYLFRRADENTSISGQSSREYLLIKKEKERRKTA